MRQVRRVESYKKLGARGCNGISVLYRPTLEWEASRNAPETVYCDGYGRRGQCVMLRVSDDSDYQTNEQAHRYIRI